jgi:ribosomal protein S4
LASILFSSGVVASPFQARQLLASGAVSVNGQKVHRSGYLLTPGDLVSIDTTFAGASQNGGKTLC